MRRNQIQMLVVAALVFFSLLGEVAPSEASTSVFQGLERYPVNGKEWIPLVDGKAYFRDAFVGGLTAILDAADGEEWGGSVVRPDGSYLYWYPIRFHSNYQGKSDCFVCSNWREPVCGSNSIMMRWYTNVRPDADSGLPCYPTGLWRYSFTKNGVAFATPEFTLLPQIPGVPCFSQGDQQHTLAIPSVRGRGDNGRITSVRCGGKYQIPWTIAAKGCLLVNAVMILQYHGVTTGSRRRNL